MNDSSAESTQSLRKELDAKKEKLEAYLAAHPGLDMNSGSEEFSQEQSDSRNVIARYEHEIQEILEGMDMLQEQKASLAEMKEKQEQLAKQYEIVEKTGEFLQRAKENFVAEYMSPVKDAFDKYYTIMTGNLDPKEFRIDANMNIERKEEGSYHNIEAQSTGYSAMIGLCIRLALLDVMYDNEKPAVVMDDPLSGLDSRNMAGAKKFLDEISKDYQVIYLSCR
jgi:DNA repair exonuclease SbcCD ATPase subunit